MQSADGYPVYSQKSLSIMAAAKLINDSDFDQSKVCHDIPMYAAGEPWHPEVSTFIIGLNYLESGYRFLLFFQVSLIIL